MDSDTHVSTMPGQLIRRLHQSSTQVFTSRARDAGFDLTSVQFAAMDAIRLNPGIDQASVAELIAYDRATIGGVVDRLETKGLVARKVSRRDRRARELWLTDEGQELFERALPVVAEMQGEILERLSPEERETFMALARKCLGRED